MVNSTAEKQDDGSMVGKHYYLKPLSFGVDCYTAKANWYKHQIVLVFQVLCIQNKVDKASALRWW